MFRRLSPTYFTTEGHRDHEGHRYQLYRTSKQPMVLRAADGTVIATIHFRPQTNLSGADSFIVRRRDLDDGRARFQGLITHDDQAIELVVTNCLADGHINLNMFHTDREVKETNPGGINQVNEFRPGETYAIKSDWTNGHAALVLSSMKDSSGAATVSVRSDEASSSGPKGTYIYISVVPETGKDDLKKWFETAEWVATDHFVRREPVPAVPVYGHRFPQGRRGGQSLLRARASLETFTMDGPVLRGQSETGTARGFIYDGFHQTSSTLAPAPASSFSFGFGAGSTAVAGSGGGDAGDGPELLAEEEESEESAGGAGGLFDDDDDWDEPLPRVMAKGLVPAPPIPGVTEEPAVASAGDVAEDAALEAEIAEVAEEAKEVEEAEEKEADGVGEMVLESKAAKLKAGAKINVQTVETNIDYAFETQAPPCVIGLSVVTAFDTSKYTVDPAPLTETEREKMLDDWLNGEYVKLLENTRVFRTDDCVIDLETPPDLVFYSCGHCCVAKENYVASMTRCPICRTTIIATIPYTAELVGQTEADAPTATAV